MKFFLISRKNFLQNIQGFWFFESIKMKSKVIYQDFQDDLSFDYVKDFLVVVEFQIDELFEEVGFVFRQ